MFAHELDLSGIVNDSYKDVAIGRRSAKNLDPNFKVSREEINQIITEAMIAAPTAVGSSPYKFLVFDTDEAKRKLNDIMWPIDKDRTILSSFVIVPLADRQWIEYFDKIVEINTGKNTSIGHGIAPEFLELVSMWYDMLCKDGGHALDISVTFQAGLVSEALMLAARSHGLECGFMDAWNPHELKDTFGVDTERYIPQGVIAFGKNTVPPTDTYRIEVADAAEFF